MKKILLFLIISSIGVHKSVYSFPSADRIYDGLQKDHYVAVPFPYTHKSLDEAMQSFLRFLALPEAQKKSLQGSLSNHHRRGDLGFTYRQKLESQTYNDQKSFFHYHPKLKEIYTREIEADPVVKDFIDRADRLWHAVYDSTKRVLSRLDTKLPGIYDKVLNTETPHIILRFLRYDIRTPGKYLAKPHYDAGSFTFALAESGPGLRIGSSPEDLRHIEQHEKQAVFFLGGNIGQLVDHAPLKSGWHDVVQVGEKPKDNTYARWAIVAFIDGHDVEGAPESVTHKWRVNEKFL